MLRIAVCDDEPSCINTTKDMISKWNTVNSVSASITCFDNGDALINEHTMFPFDIIFLDIIMPLLNGIDSAREIRKFDKDVCIVFLTSSPEFALESYSVTAFGYLVKPFNYNCLEEILNRHFTKFNHTPKSIMIRNDNRVKKIYTKDIEYVEAQNKLVIFNFSDGSSLKTKGPLYTFEDTLSIDDGFLKCHRSYIVHIPNIDSFSTDGIKMRSGHLIPLAKSFAKSFQDAYFSYMFKE